MPIRTVGEYLKRWGFTLQKPLRRAYEQNPKLIQQWLDEQYPAIAANAKKEKAEIHWGDETGLCNETIASMEGVTLQEAKLLLSGSMQKRKESI
jgi:hypothetical protein